MLSILEVPYKILAHFDTLFSSPVFSCTTTLFGQESESAEIGFLWGPKHEQFSNASLSALNLKKHFEN